MYAVICTTINKIESMHATEELAINAARRYYRQQLDYNPTAPNSFHVLQAETGDTKNGEIHPRRWSNATLLGERTYHTKARSTRYTVYTYADDGDD